MKKSNDLISIVVPCYNVENYVAKCIKSIKNQTYKNFEVIMIDDGSKDNTKKEILENIKNDDRFIYFYKKNGGLSDARNFGIKKSKGKYICFVDSDDYIEKTYLKKMYDSIIKNNTQIAICDINRVYDKTIIKDNLNNFIVETCMRPAAWNKLFLKELFDNNDIFFPIGKWYEDLGTTPKLTLNYSWSIVQEPLYNYIQRESSIIHTYNDRIFEIYEIVEDLEKYEKLNKNYDQHKKVLEFINVYHILVGTIFRSSFHEKFNIDMIKNIYKYVNNKYPNWSKNNYIKSLPLFYRFYLYALKFHMYSLIYLLLKLFNKKIKL